MATEQIERTTPMKMHKNLVIAVLKNHPEDLDGVFPGGVFASAEDAIAALQEDPHEWFVGGSLCE